MRTGTWETTVELAPGRYQYKFVVDGQWIPDPLAHDNVWNQHGTLNSVVEVRDLIGARGGGVYDLRQEVRTALMPFMKEES